eukprot:487604-Hanusia_phi.AAC.1
MMQQRPQQGTRQGKLWWRRGERVYFSCASPVFSPPLTCLQALNAANGALGRCEEGGDVAGLLVDVRRNARDTERCLLLLLVGRGEEMNGETEDEAFGRMKRAGRRSVLFASRTSGRRSGMRNGRKA